jgi:hypothetical protein
MYDYPASDADENVQKEKPKRNNNTCEKKLSTIDGMMCCFFLFLALVGIFNQHIVRFLTWGW